MLFDGRVSCGLERDTIMKDRSISCYRRRVKQTIDVDQGDGPRFDHSGFGSSDDAAWSDRDELMSRAVVAGAVDELS